MLFPAHVDTWFVLVFYGGGLAFLGFGFSLWKKNRAVAAFFGVVGVVFSAVSFHAQSVKYEVTGDGLLRRTGGLFGPTTTIAPIARIRSVAPSLDAAAVSSLEHELKVEWDAGSALVAPDDVDGFYGALQKADAHLVRTGPALVRRRDAGDVGH